MRDTSYKYYEGLSNTLNWISEDNERHVLDNIYWKILKNRTRYQKVSKKTGVPWLVVGIIHLMECNLIFTRGLHNGQHWKKVTTIVPKGRGPFSSWEAAAIDALEMKKNIMPPVWTHGSIGKFFEQYNGLGYAKKGVNSPYLWSKSKHGEGVGKYGSDGKYDPNLVSEQFGTMVVLQEFSLAFKDGELENDTGILFERIPQLHFAPRKFRKESRALQHFLNGLLESEGRKSERLKADGYAGGKTNTVYKEFFGQDLFGV